MGPYRTVRFQLTKRAVIWDGEIGNEKANDTIERRLEVTRLVNLEVLPWDK